ncbi:hypothetical protein CWS43_13065 [Rahnella sp. AA]|uniref:protein YbgS n=1 Tax=Rahnella sp. AA TaxID=2057180 RepID=UPI000C329F26|nr:protein YbgS [Rahnella sp. AA]PKE30540.1 hypothetical protein CWS43_13065 [Rahnella sp. AA]
MKKLAIMLLSASMALTTGAAYAAGESTASDNNGQANQSNSPGSIQKIAPKSVSNDQINNTDKPVNEVNTKTDSTKHHMSKTKEHKKTMCKDGRCPNQTPGTTQSKDTAN